MKYFGTSVIAGIGAAIAIGMLSFAEASFSQVSVLIAPFVATAVLVFGVPAAL